MWAAGVSAERDRAILGLGDRAGQRRGRGRTCGAGAAAEAAEIAKVVAVTVTQ